MAQRRVSFFIPHPAPEAALQDKRSHPRAPLNVDVTCELAGGSTIAAHAKDISIGGVFIESDAKVTFGTQVSIVVRLPNNKVDLRLPGVVRWLKPGGFGVQFGLLGARETHAISELFKS
jgi:hypothetical protein